MNFTMSELEQLNSPDVSDVSFDHLYRAILQCFVIILSGYIAGRAGLITHTQSAGIGTFVSKFCLPALVFKSMCELHFSEVNWKFLLGILIAKASLFILVSLVTLMVKRPLNLGYTGIFSIFATQSNDFALGYPIVQALYGNTRPEYLKYLYLIAPISFLLLNPIGFTFMEIHKHRSVQDESSDSTIRTAVIHVIKGVLLNPIVFMTAIGVIGNFVFGGSVPGVLNDILTVFGQAFNASALFYLGLSMVGKVQGQLGIGLVVPVLLITAKTIILPLITWEVVGWLEPGNSTTSFSMYGFLYGTFPSAPSVFLYANNYGIAEDVIATGLVLGTFLSAPLMFVSAKMMTVIVVSGTDYKSLLTSTSFDISIVSITCCIWVMGIFILSGKWRRAPHRFTMALMLSHILACVGMIAYYAHGDAKGWHHYPIIITLLIGVFASRCWTAAIAVVLCLLHVRSLCYVLRMQIWFYFFGFGVPVFMTGILFLVGSHDINRDIDPSFHYGTMQTVFSLVILILCLFITITSLVWWQRTERHSISPTSAYSFLKNDGDANVTPPRQSTSDKDEYAPNRSSYVRQESISSCRAARPSISDYDQGGEIDTTMQQSEVTSPVAHRPNRNYQTCSADQTVKKSTSIEDLVPYSSQDLETSVTDIMQNISERTCLLGECNTEQRHACMDRLRSYTVNVLVNGDAPQEEDIKTTKDLFKEEYQTAHHLILLLLLLLSMFIGMFLCAWRVFRSTPTGIYVEIEFLDCVFNYGQGLLILIVFGFDTRLVFSPIVRRLRRFLFGAEVLHLPKMSELDAETKHICQQFTEYHKNNCAREIVRDRRFRFRLFKNVFTGTAMCDWLVRAGLASDRDSAVTYGRHLVLGRVVTHMSSEHDFHDTPYFYKFLDTFEYMAC